jgi:hypothetical protein
MYGLTNKKKKKPPTLNLMSQSAKKESGKKINTNSHLNGIQISCPFLLREHNFTKTALQKCA